jgi:RNA polymerase sigma factor (TIGR02999 family)
MRRVLVEHARTRRAAKRGGGDAPLPLDEARDAAEVEPGRCPEDVLSVHVALERLEQLSPRQARVVEMRVFGGLDNGEIAAALAVSATTVKRDWTAARAWLYGELRSARAQEPSAP